MHKGIKFILTLVVISIIGGLSFTTYYFYSQYQKAQSLVANPQEITKNEITDIISKISLSMELPSGEEPTLATILEAEKLKNQPFFTNAQNGDKVLIYAQAKKAILYRPSLNKIIEVSPLSLVDNGSNPNATPTPTTETKSENSDSPIPSDTQD